MKNKIPFDGNGNLIHDLGNFEGEIFWFDSEETRFSDSLKIEKSYHSLFFDWSILYRTTGPKVIMVKTELERITKHFGRINDFLPELPYKIEKLPLGDGFFTCVLDPSFGETVPAPYTVAKTLVSVLSAHPELKDEIFHSLDIALMEGKI